MVKMPPGYDPENGDWWYGKFDREGDEFLEKMNGKVPGCIACHQGASDTDYLFSEDVMEAITELSITLTDEILVEDLIGKWRILPGGSYVEFKANGTYNVAWSVNQLGVISVEEGLYTLEGTLFTFISSEESASCFAGARGVYELERTYGGNIRQVILEDECVSRGSAGSVFLDRVIE
jgi:hypothetical protein